MQTLSGSEKMAPKSRSCSASSISNCSSQYYDSHPSACACLHIPSPHRSMWQLKATSWPSSSSRVMTTARTSIKTNNTLMNKIKNQLSTWPIMLQLLLLLLYSFSEKKKKLICQIPFGIYLQSLEFCISTFLIAIKIFLRKINEWGLLKVISKFRAVIMVMVLWVYTYLQTPQVVCIKYVQLYAYHTSIK